MTGSIASQNPRSRAGKGEADPPPPSSPTLVARIGAYLEIALALALFVLVILPSGARALIVGGLRATGGGARSTFALALVDPGTIVSALLVLLRFVLIYAPTVRMMVRSPRQRLAWIPFLAVVGLAVMGTSLPAISTPAMWALLVVAAAAAWYAAGKPWVRALALLPWIVALEPLLGHSPLSELVWGRDRLARQCARNDGIGPDNFSPDLAVTRYFSVTPVSPDLMLLSGERRSFWVHRDAQGMHLGPQLPLHGNLWQGCVRDGSVWLTARARVCEATVPRDAGDLDAPTECQRVPGPPEVGREMDYVDVLCPNDRSSVYVTQLLRGGYIEFDRRAGTERWHRVVSGLNLQGVMRDDGRIVAITTSRLVLFDPRTDTVLQDQPAGIVAMGIDICRTSGDVVVSDFSGRVRRFDRERGGTYRFRAGASLAAARRVAFSPDCSKLLVTSGDDRHAYVMRSSDLSVQRTFRLGPGLRDVAFLDGRWAAAADACTVRLLDTGGSL